MLANCYKEYGSTHVYQMLCRTSENRSWTYEVVKTNFQEESIAIYKFLSGSTTLKVPGLVRPLQVQMCVWPKLMWHPSFLSEWSKDSWLFRGSHCTKSYATTSYEYSHLYYVGTTTCLKLHISWKAVISRVLNLCGPYCWSLHRLFCMVAGSASIIAIPVSCELGSMHFILVHYS